MTFSDKEKLSRLFGIFDTNFKVTNLYADYLNIYPELITKEMISEITADGDITIHEAIVALLSELFGLDDENGGIERKIIREYLTPSVKVLDIEKYIENPYYKNVAPEDAKCGSFELKWEYYPPYRAAISGDMIIKDDYTEIPPLGFFTEGFQFPAVLEDGNEWMTLTPVDLDTSEEAIERAYGKVVTFGLGLGYYAYMASEKREVESITVVEKSADVIELFKSHILPKFSHPEKVRIVCEDAFVYAEKIMPSENFNYAFVDTWRDASDGLPMYERMKALEPLSPNTKFDYWIENFIISRKRALKFGELWDAYEENREDAPKSYEEFIRRLNE